MEKGERLEELLFTGSSVSVSHMSYAPEGTPGINLTLTP
jgi:hypothetical protein